MQYQSTVAATFLERPNRFIAHVLVDGVREVAHVKNTGRCKELLIPGCRVYLSASDRPTRKTKYDLIAVEKKRHGAPLLINMDSQIPNDVAEEWLRRGDLLGKDISIRREVRYGASRFDFYVEAGARRIFLEVKGVTLEHHGIALFPDAPTERGVKHVRELIACRREGFEACVLFVVQMKGVHRFSPNDATHLAFGEMLRLAAKEGVNLFAVDCLVTPNEILPDAPVPILL